MANINLYRIDPNKFQTCLQDLSSSSLQRKQTIFKTKNVNNTNHEFGATLYLEEPHQSDEALSWNWLLNEFDEQPFYAFKSPKAVLLIEEIDENIESAYAVTFGSSYFKIDKFCDRDFGFNFASRMEYTNIKTTTLTSPNLTRNKTINTYINYNQLDFNSGESFSKLKVNVKLDENFLLFKPAIEIGNSIRFNIENESIDGILDVILYVKDILEIPADEVKYKIPLFQLVKDDILLDILNQKMEFILTETLLGKQNTPLFSIPELEIIGTSEIFNHLDDEFKLKYLKSETENLTHLTIETVKQFCQDNAIDTIDKITKIRLVRYRNGESVVSLHLKDIIEYTDDENKCVLSGGKWYLFNHDYLTYLNESIKEIQVLYKNEYDFNDQIHNQFVDEKYVLEKNAAKYNGKTECQIKKSLKQKYYAERCFNLLREQEGTFSNHDRVGTSDGFEKMDLYEKATATMFAVKKGKASSDLCYAIDQSLTALKKYKHGEIVDMPLISHVGLWFILERTENLPIIQNNEVDLCSLDMLMLKNRIDQWKKEVRLSGYTPIIYINYRS